MRLLARLTTFLAIAVSMVAHAAPDPFDATRRDAALAQVESAIRSSYVVADLREPIVATLEASRRAGRYDGGDPIAFATRVTEDLRDASRDGHLYLRADPRGHEALRAPKPIVDEAALDHRRAVRGNHGLGELRILAGNVRYLRIRGFEWVPDATGRAYDDAMRFLKDGDAWIIDLRGNGGGDGAAVRYLVSHFLDDDQLLVSFLEAGRPPIQSRTLGYLPSGRLKGKPLFVLIDARVGSAAEEFAYHVEQFELGTLVGATTAGAANNNKLVPIDPAFVLSVSIGYPEHAISHANWEGRGIAPTVATTSERALDVAHDLAVRRIAESAQATPDAVDDARWAAVATHARVAPPNLSAAALASHAGTYDRIALVVRDGSLWIDRGPRGTTRLVPLTNDGLFGFDGDDGQRVRATGDAIELQRQGGGSLLLRRGPPGRQRSDG